jgi:hypothetical protein
MIGKLFLPIAIGGGLLALLASSAKADQAPRNPFDVLPANLRILAAQAQGTNDPGMLEQTADQLEMQGFVQAAGVLRTQADQIRRIRAGSTPATPFDALPNNLRVLAAQAQGTNDPGALEQTADQLEKHGFVQAAGVLRTQAEHARRTRGTATPPPAPPTTAAAVPNTPPTNTTPPFVPDSDKKATQLTPELQKMIADAIANGTAPVLTSTAFVLERAQPEAQQKLAANVFRRIALSPPS